MLEPNDIDSPMLAYWLKINGERVHTVGENTTHGGKFFIFLFSGSAVFLFQPSSLHHPTHKHLTTPLINRHQITPSRQPAQIHLIDSIPSRNPGF